MVRRQPSDSASDRDSASGRGHRHLVAACSCKPLISRAATPLRRRARPHRGLTRVADAIDIVAAWRARSRTPLYLARRPPAPAAGLAAPRPEPRPPAPPRPEPRLGRAAPATRSLRPAPAPRALRPEPAARSLPAASRLGFVSIPVDSGKAAVEGRLPPELALVGLSSNRPRTAAFLRWSSPADTTSAPALVASRTARTSSSSCFVTRLCTC